MYDGDPSDHHGRMEGTPVYWLPKKNTKYRLELEDAEAFLRSPEFRIRYKLSNSQHDALVDCILDDNCPESKGLVKKFYDIREDLEERLYEEMVLSDGQYLRVDYPEDKKEWSGMWLTVASTGAGKTWNEVSKAIAMLQGPITQRRQIIYVSTELDDDETLKKLMARRYDKWVTGVDTSDTGFEAWSENEHNSGSVQEWFDQTILPPIENAPKSSHVVVDDPKDSMASKQILKLLNKALRTYRHKGIGVTSLQHAIRGRGDTSQSYSSVKGVTLFPAGGGKGKLQAFLADDVGLGIKRARSVVKLFADTGRKLIVLCHTPTALVGDRVILLV
jgi:hypothetical protein